MFNLALYTNVIKLLNEGSQKHSSYHCHPETVTHIIWKW